MLEQERKENIRLKAREVLYDIENDDNGKQLPINLGKIIDRYNINLEKTDFSNITADANSDIIVGAYDGTSRTIYTSENDSYPKKAFVIAHELGHYFFHTNTKDVLFLKDVLNMGKVTDKREQEANIFALNLLMPKRLIMEYWDKTNNINIMRKIFGVTELAMEYRLKKLGLL